MSSKILLKNKLNRDSEHFLHKCITILLQNGTFLLRHISQTQTHGKKKKSLFLFRVKEGALG